MRPLSPVLSDAPICQAKANSDKHAERICDLVVQVCAAVEGGLYQLNYGAKCARAKEDGDQPKLASAGQREGKSREGNEVYQLVAPPWDRGWRLKRPEHRDG